MRTLWTVPHRRILRFPGGLSHIPPRWCTVCTYIPAAPWWPPGEQIRRNTSSRVGAARVVAKLQIRVALFVQHYREFIRVAYINFSIKNNGQAPFYFARLKKRRDEFCICIPNFIRFAFPFQSQRHACYSLFAYVYRLLIGPRRSRTKTIWPCETRGGGGFVVVLGTSGWWKSDRSRGNVYTVRFWRANFLQANGECGKSHLPELLLPWLRSRTEQGYTSLSLAALLTTHAASLHLPHFGPGHLCVPTSRIKRIVNSNALFHLFLLFRCVTRKK